MKKKKINKRRYGPEKKSPEKKINGRNRDFDTFLLYV